MPKFDVNLWKSIHPASTEGSGMVAALKDWVIMCPDNYEESKVAPQKVASGVSTATKRFMAAITDAEGKLSKDKNPDPKEKDKIAKTKALLAKWEKEATSYYKAVAKWAQDSVKEESEEKKNLQRAQAEFSDSLVGGLTIAMLKMPALAKEFDANLRAGNIDVAQTKFALHRDLVQKAFYLLKPVAIAKEKSDAADKFDVEITQLQIPPKFNELVKKLQEMNTLDGTMNRRLQKAIQGEEDTEDEADPAYDNAITEMVIFSKKYVNKIKAMVPPVAQCADGAKNVAAIRVTDPAFTKGIAACRALGNKMYELCNQVLVPRNQIYGKGSPLSRKKVAAKISDEDFSKSVDPVLKLGQSDIKKIAKFKDQMTETLCAWLDDVLKAHPESREAKHEQDILNARKGAFTAEI